MVDSKSYVGVENSFSRYDLEDRDGFSFSPARVTKRYWLTSPQPVYIFRRDVVWLPKLSHALVKSCSAEWFAANSEWVKNEVLAKVKVPSVDVPHIE